ncbi:RsmB/NOP family class I SAM-dependent RNA methyltransferase [Sphingobacterium lumbrici]|uniref:RsmB/NOP family class I SAM-dependent RNA methyltransferase n=1 Tax=Sphingobacterium lumbrici TaxID=2559600 RepID=UPI0011264395|nr:RsmB/NOP family class I SAM-dependent RNA methyltransferase [Sphingobacterium lumbrici]
MEVNERRINQQVRSFEKALNGFSNTEPFARYLTRFFKENKQMGSSDRRMTSRFCYNYFRIGKAKADLPAIERLALAEYLCETHSELVVLVYPDLLATMGSSVTDKIKVLFEKFNFQLGDVFPFSEYITENIEKEAFIASFFTQPNLFIRIKRGFEKEVKSELENVNFAFEEIGLQTLALPNGTKLQQLVRLEGKYEVQDLSSQRTIQFIEALPNQSWWDACAASGGKALLFLDKYPKTHLLVSDIRMSILRNLDERFQKANIRQDYRKKVIDLTKDTTSILGNELFDGIILDAPCTGSGTWGRTPEMIQQFSVNQLAEFSDLQRNIAKHVVRHLKPGGVLTYITCSVFKEENENAVDYMVNELGLKLDRWEVIKGYEDKADSMFAARLIKQ